MTSLKRRLLYAGAALGLGVAVGLTPAAPARAIAVFDGANYSQNLLQAARALVQINNQVQQLANEAQMLLNQARNLERLPTSVAGQLTLSLGRVDALIRNAQGLAYQVGAIDGEYRRLFPEQYAAAVTSSRIVQDAREAWGLARHGHKHALEMQAEVVGQVRADVLTLDDLVAQSQGAVGNLQALQAGNQLTALATKQAMQLQSLLAASARADALERADALAEQARARARFQRFLGDGSAYTRP